VGLALHPILTILIALAPAAFSFWRGRALLHDLEDPALPERLLALQRRNTPVLVVTVVALLFVSPERMGWALPLMMIAKMLAGYPLRRSLHSETWSVWAYLSFYLRLVVAALGFWLLVASLPTLAARAGTSDWIVAGALGAIAVAWNARYASVFRFILRTRPVDAPGILTRFSQLRTSCGLSNIKLDQVNLRGGVFANAVALPSIRTPAVVVTDTLMARLDEDEVTAILAHEVAHLEHYNPKRLMQANISAWVLICVGVLLSPVLRLAAPGLPGFVFLFWPVVILAGLMLQLQHRQKHETESDLRAVALTGDPEALVRALTKLHAFARMPRRWEAEFERHATHPSLARRIQAIRRASGAEPQTITEPERFVGTDPAASVTFHDDRLELHEGSSMTHAIRYQSLRELRIDVRSSAAPQLLAVDSAARRWTIPLQTGDVARAQGILDVIDGHLGKAESTEPALVPLNITRLLMLILIVGGMAVGQLSLLLIGSLALAQPVSQIATAAGVSALAAAVLAWRDGLFWQVGDFSVWLPVTLSLCGTAVIATAFANRHNAPREAGTKLLGVLAASASLAWATVGFSGTAAIDFHRNVREWPAVVVLTLGCAGALAYARPRKARWAALPVALIGIVAGYIGSTGFVDRFVDDSFVAPAPTIDLRTPATSPLNEFSVDFYPSLLRLSPSGQYVAFTTENAHEVSTIHAGKAGGSLAPFTADDAMFLSESRLLLLERQQRVSVLRLVDLAEGHREEWSLNVPVLWPDLSIDASSRQWRLLGRDAANDVISAEGTVGATTLHQTHWKSPADAHHLQLLGMSDGNVIALESRHDYSAMRFFPLIPFLSPLGRTESRLWRLNDRGAAMFGASNAEVTCHASSAIGGPATCVAFDGSRTRFFAIDAATQQLAAQASIASRIYVSNIDDSDWLIGWWNQSPAALHPGTRRAVEFGNETGARPYQIAMGTHVMAGIFPQGRTSTVRIYSALK
jgi:Zn-dependent protease with chaperone function